MGLLFLKFLPDVLICQPVGQLARLPPTECARLFSSPNERTNERAGEKRERKGERVRQGGSKKEKKVGDSLKRANNKKINNACRQLKTSWPPAVTYPLKST